MRMSKLNEERLAEIRYKKCLNDLLDFYLYGDCLPEEISKEYFDYLKRKILNETYSNKNILKELAPKDFADILKRKVFDKKVSNSEDAMLSHIQRIRKGAQSIKYERKKNFKDKDKTSDKKLEIVKNGLTHLALNDGTFCNKPEFIKAFKNEKFDTTDDVSSTAPTTMLNEYLEAFDDDGWLISTADKDGYKEIQSLRKTN